MKVLTVDKDSKAEEIQVSFSSAGVPADVRVALGKEHRTHLQPTACQVCHHLHHTNRVYEIKRPLLLFMHFNFLYLFIVFQTISRSCSCKAKASSLLSIQEAAATSRGVDPRMPADIKI